MRKDFYCKHKAEGEWDAMILSAMEKQDVKVDFLR